MRQKDKQLSTNHYTQNNETKGQTTIYKSLHITQ